MDLNEYQQEVMKTVIYPVIGHRMIYPALGLVGEAGEVANIIKKIFRDDGGTLNPDHLDRLYKELGDVLWYVAALCCELGFNIDGVAQQNLEKLKDRQRRGVLKGRGDNR